MINVITPFSRVENKELLIKVFEGKCRWTILQADNEPVIDFPSWVEVKRYPVYEKQSISNRLFNAFIEEGLEDETQYIILPDDDSVEDGFFDKIPDADVVCVSMKRNDKEIDHIVWDDWATKQGHIEKGIDVLIAKPENMKPARVGGEQLILKGKILKDFRYGMEDSSSDVPGDWKLIRDVLEKYTPVFVPDAYVLFNYFEEGRFDSFRRKPIVLFIGDYFCAGVRSMGKSEWEGNLWASLEALNTTNIARFHFDKYFYYMGQRADKTLLERIEIIKPDYIVLVIYKEPASDPTVIALDTIKEISKYKLITIWGDLEAEEQVNLSKLIAPYCYKVIGTANKEIVEGLGYTYMHVPKDPRIFNNITKDRDIEVLFNGSFGHGREERRAVLQYLIDKGIKLVAGGSEGADHFTTEEYAERYKRAKISISFSQARGKNVVNARPFEVMNCGSLLLEQESPELAKLYTPGVDYVSWKDAEDLYEKICYYLKHEDERALIANSGYNKTQELYSSKTFWDKVLK